MTKFKAPLTVPDALAGIARQLSPRGGWRYMAEIAGREVSTVYNWGNPDTPESVPLDIAVRFDLAHKEAGGDGAPLHDVYALLLRTGMEQRFATQAEIARRARQAIREDAEAEDAQLACALPGATDDDWVRAIRETQQAIDLHTNTLALLLKKGAGPDEVTSVEPTGVGQ
jgi:hypothetical protein